MKLIILIILFAPSIIKAIESENKKTEVIPPNILKFGQVLLGKTVNLEMNDNKEDEIVMKGWMKYFVTVSSISLENEGEIDIPNTLPKKFEINQDFWNQYSSEQETKFSKDDQDEFGWINIPNETSFFFVLTSSTLFVLSGRRNDIVKTVKSLEISWIMPIKIVNKKENKCLGGLYYLGNFKEGSCFRIKTKTNAIWTLCSEKNIADGFFEALKKLIPNEDSLKKFMEDISGKNNLLKSLPNLKQFLPPSEIKTLLSSLSIEDTNSTTARNGNWVVIQDWSQCTLSCGGGKQYLQRICVPPNNGGKNCEGPKILERPCNEMPCPDIDYKKDNEKILPTIIEMHRISNRPQRFELCVIKEGDMNLMLEDSNSELMPRIPVRVVLNNKTISVFLSPNDYKTIYKSFDLKYLNMKNHPSDPASCIVLLDKRDEQKRATICIMATNLHVDETIQKSKERWIYDIQYFTERCKEKKAYRRNSEELEKERQALLAEKMKEVEEELHKKKLEEIENEDNEGEEKAIEERVEKTAKIALSVELKYEESALKEEIEHEKLAESEWYTQIQKEKEKEECIQKELQRKAKNRVLEKRVLDMASKISEIQKQAVIQVQNSRQHVSVKIEAMRRALARRRKLAQQKIIEIRTRMASDLLHEAKLGTKEACDPFQKYEDRMKYCDENFFNDPQRDKDCRSDSTNDFCNICCENEFGRLNEEKREDCYQMCDRYSIESEDENSNNQLEKKSQNVSKKNGKATISFLKAFGG